MAYKSLRSPAGNQRLVITYTILVGVCVVLILPLVWLLLTSLKKETEYLSYPIQVLPVIPQWSNYVAALTMAPFWQYARNSLTLGLTFSILTVLTSAMCGFAFARIPVPGRSRLFKIVVAMLMVPTIVTLIPQFIVFARLGLTNTFWPWVLWGLSASPFHIFLFRQFFTAIPKELEDAAEVDGCGWFRIFWQIFLPNAKPVLATSFIFSFSWVWGDYLTPLIYLGADKAPLAVALTKAYTTEKGFPLITVTMAACVLYTIPLIILFFVGQRYLVRGVVTTGLKG